MEVISDLAFAVPVRVLAGLLGVPTADGLRFRDWADRILAFQGVNKPSEATLLTAQQALLEVRAYLTALVEQKRRDPGNDLVSRMVTERVEGDVLSDAEIINTGITLLDRRAPDYHLIDR